MSSMVIAAIGSLVWAHHMFTSGMADTARIIFSFLTFLVSIPSAVKVFNWLATMYKGSIRLEVPFLWTLAFIFLFTIGGFTGLMQGALSIDIHIHDTSFIVAHFHYTMFGGTGAMFIAALHYWFPKMFGRMYDKQVALAGFVLWFVGFMLTYVPALRRGLSRHAASVPGLLGPLLQYEAYHQWSTYGSWIMITGLLVVIWNVIRLGSQGAAGPRRTRGTARPSSGAWPRRRRRTSSPSRP